MARTRMTDTQADDQKHRLSAWVLVLILLLGVPGAAAFAAEKGVTPRQTQVYDRPPELQQKGILSWEWQLGQPLSQVPAQKEVDVLQRQEVGVDKYWNKIQYKDQSGKTQEGWIYCGKGGATCVEKPPPATTVPR